MDRRRMPHQIRWPAMAIMIALALVCATAQATEPFYKLERETSTTVDLRALPSEDSRVMDRLAEGTPVTLIDQHKGWFAARLDDNRLGWIRENYLRGRRPRPIAGPETVRSAPSPAEQRADSATAASAGAAPAADETAPPEYSEATEAAEAAEAAAAQQSASASTGSTSTGSASTGSASTAMDATEVPTQYLRLKVASGRARAEPSLEAGVMFGLEKGEVVGVIDSRQEWYRIITDTDRKGWAHRMLFEPASDEEAADLSLAFSGAAEPALARPASAKPSYAEPASDALASEALASEAPASSKPAPSETARATPAETDSATAPVTPMDPGDGGERVLRTFRVESAGAAAEQAIFELSGFYPPETFVLEEDTPKVVCDFPEVTPGTDMPRRLNVNGDMIQRIRTGIHTGGAPKLRVVLDLRPNQDYTVEQVFIKGENRYILTFKPGRGA